MEVEAPEALYYIALLHYVILCTHTLSFILLGCHFYFDMSNVPFKGSVLEAYRVWVYGRTIRTSEVAMYLTKGV